jgi:gamma-glutamyl-gamma-aminobutyrate hydrolase PuuD
MTVAIIPSIKEPYPDQFEYSVDINLLNILKKNFPKTKVQILSINDQLNKDLKLLIFSGGNTIKKIKKTKKNLLREKLDNKFFNQAKQKNIFVLGICHGAQFLADKIGCEFEKKNHLGEHKIYFSNKKVLKVNSYHNYIIKKFKKKDVKILAKAKDNSIEYYMYNKFIGIMWHPERNKNLKMIDKKIFKYLLCN